MGAPGIACRTWTRGARQAALLALGTMMVLSAALQVEAAVPPAEPANIMAAQAPLPAVYGHAPHRRTVAEPQLAGPRLSAAHAALIDARTGRLLYVQRAHDVAYPASTTKILTALVAYESLPLGQLLTVPPEAVGVEGSSIYLEAGEELTVEELLFGLLLHSGNDAAVTLAVAAAGSVEEFASRMNHRARLAGAQATHFTNPHGLTDRDHVTTAYDLALIAAEALTHPPLARMVATERRQIAWAERPYDRLLINNNRLLGELTGADGIKTGYTTAAGRCLVASVTRDGQTLIAVLLDAPELWNDARKLLEFGFDAYRFETVAAPGMSLLLEAPPRLLGGRGEPVEGRLEQGLVVPLAPGERERLGAWVELPSAVYAPLQADAPIGRLSLTLDGQPLAPRYQAVVRLAAPLPRHPFVRLLDRWFELMRQLTTRPVPVGWVIGTGASQGDR